MGSDDSMTAGTAASTIQYNKRIAGVSFVVGALLFLTGGAITIVADPPPSSAPALGMASHALWFLAISFLTFGTGALVRLIPTLKEGLDGYLATGTLGLGSLHGLQWVAWAYVDVRASRHEEYELLIEPLISSFGAAHLLVYGILAGSGVAFLGLSVARTRLTHRFMGWAAIAIGTLTVTASGISLLAILTGGSDGHLLFNGATLLLAVLFGWALLFGIDLFRRDIP